MMTVVVAELESIDVEEEEEVPVCAGSVVPAEFEVEVVEAEESAKGELVGCVCVGTAVVAAGVCAGEMKAL